MARCPRCGFNVLPKVRQCLLPGANRVPCERQADTVYHGVLICKPHALHFFEFGV